MPAKILLQTTIPTTLDDWSIARFSALTALLAGMRDEHGGPVFEVTARDRDPPGAPDSVLAALDSFDYAALWLFAVDTGDGLTPEDCAGVSKFRRRGGGMMVTRDHQDLGSSVCTLGGVGEAHFFHSRNPDPDESRRAIDDAETTYISWPNYHSGANGDFQSIHATDPLHPVMTATAALGHRLRFPPAHPHEGGVGAPAGDPSARVIATGISKTTGNPFNIAVAFEPSQDGGPAIAQSTFHHFADYNWNPRRGSPSFVTETPSDRLARSPEAQAHLRQYVRNLALWLAGLPWAAARAAAHLDEELDEALKESFPASDPPSVV
jgi:hypothetical protein